MRSNSIFIQRDPFREFESLFRQAFAPPPSTRWTPRSARPPRHIVRVTTP